MKWAALLHDISKRGEPEFKGRDHTHPFTAGLSVLQIFHRFGHLQADLLKYDMTLNEESLELVYALIEQSIHDPVEPDYAKNFKEGEKFCTEIHSHE